MTPRISPPARGVTRLLVVDPCSEASDSVPFSGLAEALRPGDLLVINDAATLPAALWAEVDTPHGPTRAELRLFSFGGDEAWVIALGDGDHHSPTELRGDPPAVPAGATVRIRGEVFAQVMETSGLGGRLWRLGFSRLAPSHWRQLYASGRAIQYAYIEGELALWDVQTLFASRPCAGEMPSAARAIDFALLTALRRRGIGVERLTHAAGLSSAGNDDVDRTFPLPESYRIPARTMTEVRDTRARGGRVVAVGTTVARALESEAARLLAGGPARDLEGTATLKLGPDSALRIVDGILTGLHEIESSHFSLLTSFLPRERLLGAMDKALDEDLRGHEFGDAMLVLRQSA